MPLRGGAGRRLMANTILNFHFDYLHTSHRQTKNTKSRERMDLTPPPTFSSNLILWTKVLNAGVQEIRSVSLVRTCKPLWISLMHRSLHCITGTFFIFCSSSVVQTTLLLMPIMMLSWWLCVRAWNWTASIKIPWQIIKCTLIEYSIFQQYTNTQQHSTLNNTILQKRQ